MQKTSFIFYSLLVLPLLLSHCKKSIQLEVDVDVKDHIGAKLSEATISLAGSEVGQTDREGHFHYKGDFPRNALVKVQVAKESEKLYYAPFFDRLQLTADKHQRQSIEAVLYFVPKTLDEDDVLGASVDQEKPAASASPMEKPEAATSEPAASETAEERVTIPPLEVESTEIEKPEEPDSHLTFAVHVYSGKRPVNEAHIFFGEEATGHLQQGCSTNIRGRCLLKLDRTSEDATLTLVVRHQLYQTASKTIKITDQGRVRFDLQSGHSLDVFAVTKNFNRTRGVKGVEVVVRGEKVGQTDSFGRFTHMYTGNPNDLVDVQLKNREFYPESYETDFVISGPRSLVKFFAPKTPAKPGIALLPLQPKGALAGDVAAILTNEDLHTQLDRALTSLSVVKKIPPNAYQQAMKRMKLTLPQILKSGWNDTDLKNDLDFLVVPLLVSVDPTKIELTLVDSVGKTAGAAVVEFPEAQGPESQQKNLATAATKLFRSFPFEGAVREIHNELIHLGFGSEAAPFLQAGDALDVWGVQADEHGHKKLHRRIASARIEKTVGDLIVARVLSTEKRAKIQLGDLVIRKGPLKSTQEKISLTITAPLNQNIEPVANANVYANGEWLATTDATGRAELSRKSVKGNGELKITKYGYQDSTLSTDKRAQYEVALQRSPASLQIETQPSGLPIKLDGIEIGKSPLLNPVEVKGGFVKLEVDAPKGYLPFHTVLDIDQGLLRLTGDQKVVLEKDFRKAAREYVQIGDFRKALHVLEEIPATHSQFLLGLHDQGEILLNRLEEPALAAEAFGKVTTQPSVKDFNDKRFIGTHINEGMAVFLTADKLERNEPLVAKAHLQKAYEIFEAVLPQLRHVPKNQFVKALHTTAYHRALAAYKLWQITREKLFLEQTVAAWQRYLDETKDSPGAGKEYSDYATNANVYLKQAYAALDLNKQSDVASK